MNYINTPYQDLKATAEFYSKGYHFAQPFPNITFPNFFNPGMLEEVRREFPRLTKENSMFYNSPQELKYASRGTTLFGPWTRGFVKYLNSPEFINFLQALTGIKEPLVPDHEFMGGGLHQIPRGGFLKLHADFNKKEIAGKKLDRRLNLLIYLNKDCKDEYGGHFELWNKDRSKCMQRIAPVFNTMALFSTTSTSYHGHPDPLKCPEGMNRISIALYYYSDGRPAEEITAEHTTKFVGRKGHWEGQRLRDRVKNYLRM